MMRPDNLTLTYDINNQPDNVRFSNMEAVRYYYDAMGNRLGSDEYTQPTHTGAGLSLPALRSRSTRRFCGNIVYDGSSISQILFDGGYITLNDNGSPIYHFYVTDHQGNNRLVVDAEGDVEERNDYYPYGALMSNSTTSIQRYKYNGKELNQHSYMLWYDYMARQTMPILGRFSSVDPLCEKYYGMSPYMYCAGNPVRFVDPYGSFIMCKGSDGTYYRYVNDGDNWSFVNNTTGVAYSGGDSFVNEVINQFSVLANGTFGAELLSKLSTHDDGVIIFNGDSGKDYFYENKISNPKLAEMGLKSKVHVQSKWMSPVPGAQPYTDLGHEMAHALDRLKGTIDESTWIVIHGQNGDESIPEAEKYATFYENGIRSEHGLSARRYYSYNSYGMPNQDTQLLDSKNRSLFIDVNRNIRKGIYNIERGGDCFKFNF